MNASTFQPYSIYYSTPRGEAGQVPIIGRHFYAEGMWLPIVAETTEEVKARGERAVQDRIKVRAYTGKSAAELDEQADNTHHRNMWYTKDADL